MGNTEIAVRWSAWTSGILSFAAVPAALAAIVLVSADQSLQFGRFVAASGGTVTISPQGTRSASGGIILSGGSYAQASFTVTGTAGDNYSISLPANGVAVMTGPGSDMPVNGFVSFPGGSGTLDASGQQIIQVGATLTVNAAQTTGSYSGSFEIVVNSQ